MPVRNEEQELTSSPLEDDHNYFQKHYYIIIF